MGTDASVSASDAFSAQFGDFNVTNGLKLPWYAWLAGAGVLALGFVLLLRIMKR